MNTDHHLAIIVKGGVKRGHCGVCDASSPPGALSQIYLWWEEHTAAPRAKAKRRKARK